MADVATSSLSAGLPVSNSATPQIPEQTLLTLRNSAKRTRELFSTPGSEDFLARTTTTPDDESLASKVAVTSRLRNEYDNVRELPSHLAEKHANAVAAAAARRKKAKQDKETKESGNQTLKMIEGIPSSSGKTNGDSTALTLRGNVPDNIPGFGMGKATNGLANQSLARYRAVQQPKPDWHAPWKLMRVISGHLGWVRSLAVEPGNEWFASGAGDRTIKIWDLATGNLKLTLTGHISTVRGLAVSPRHPYLFSCGEDKMVKCWDLETNKVIRHYHGHLSGVYTLDLHPELDVLVTGGRDGVARVWDMRTRVNVHVLSGHRGTVSDLKCQEADPQVITSSLDAQVRLWDLAAGKTMSVLTHHKKGVRALTVHPREFTFASASTGSIKQWKCPEGAFMGNFEGQSSIINTLAVNDSDVLFSGGDDGSISFWDWKTGFRFQNTETTAQPGSLEAESGIFSSTFDKSGLRLITGEADKTIKVWKEDTDATPESHPLDWKPTLSRVRY